MERCPQSKKILHEAVCVDSKNLSLYEDMCVFNKVVLKIKYISIGKSQETC